MDWLDFTGFIVVTAVRLKKLRAGLRRSRKDDAACDNKYGLQRGMKPFSIPF